MPSRLTTSLTFAFAAFGVLLFTACGGGGGTSSGSVIPNGGGGSSTATPTPAPTVVTFPASLGGASCTQTAAAVCAVTIKSIPSGMAVTMSANGGAPVPIGVTPLTTSPTFSVNPYVVAIGSNYSTTLSQTGGHAQTIFYNATTDTGSVAVTGAKSAARSVQSVASVSTNTSGRDRRAINRFTSSAGVVPNGVYVKYNSEKLQRSVTSIETSAGADGAYDILPSVAAVRGRIVHVPQGTDFRTVAANLAANPAVAGVYPLHYRRALTAATRHTVTDFDFNAPGNLQWSLDTIKATYAWTYTNGSHATIAMIDTGVDLTHPDLPSSKVVFQANTAGTQGVIVTTAGAAQDTNGHGTNTAAIAAANGNDGIGFAGVAYGAHILAYRIFPQATAANDEQSADTADEALAITDASTASPAHAQADVINLSIGAPEYDGAETGFDQAEHDAIEAAIARGTVVVAAAGNEKVNPGSQTIDYPAAYDGVISVGASALFDSNSGVLGAPTTEYVATYSNPGAGLGVVAPGGDDERVGNGDDNDNLHWIRNDSTQSAAMSADQCTSRALPDVCQAEFMGTSQATPHVAGTVALVQSALRENGKTPLTPAAMTTLIEGTADNINDPLQGHGRLNALRAVESALGLPQSFTPAASSPTQFVAFAYTGSGGTRPAIADVFFTAGVPLDANGAFRIADIDPSLTSTYRIGVWLDANGDGVIDAGDQFGAATTTCTATAKCSIAPIAVTTVGSSFSLP